MIPYSGDSIGSPAQANDFSSVCPSLKQEGWITALAGVAVALALFGGAMLIGQRAGLPQGVLPLGPALLAVLVIFSLWPTLALVLWVLCSGLAPWPILGREVFLYDLFTLVLLALWWMKVMAQGRLRISGPDWAVVMVILAALLSVLMNLGRMPEVQERFTRLRHFPLEFLGKTNVSAGLLWLSYLLAYVFASRMADTPRRICWVLGAVVAMGVANSLYALWFWVNNPMGFSRDNRTVGLLQEPQDQGYLSAMLLTGVVVVLVLRLVRGSRLGVVLAVGTVLLLNFVFNFTRSAYAEFAVAMLALLFITRSRRVLLVLAFSGAFLFLILHLIEVDKKALVFLTQFAARKGVGLTLRMESWSDALRIFREEGGFWGVGLGNYATYSEAIIIIILRRRVASAHSMYLQILAEQGIPGLVAWASFFVIMLRYYYSRMRQAADLPGKAFNLWLVLILLMYLLDGVFYQVLLPPGHSHEALTAGFFVWVLLGLGVAYNRYRESAANGTARV